MQSSIIKGYQLNVSKKKKIASRQNDAFRMKLRNTLNESGDSPYQGDFFWDSQLLSNLFFVFNSNEFAEYIVSIEPDKFYCFLFEKKNCKVISEKKCSVLHSQIIIA